MAAKEWTMTLEGARELEQALYDLPRRIGKAALRRALVTSGEPLAKTGSAILKSKITSRTGVLLGRVQAGVFISSRLSKNQKRGKRVDRNTVEIYVGPYKARHAHLIEFGTAPRRTKTGAYRGYLKPRPFMRPAWEMEKGKILPELSKLMGEEVAKAAKRYERKLARQAAKG